MKILSVYRSKQTYARLAVLLLAICALTMYGCENQSINPEMISGSVIEKPVASVSLGASGQEPIEETMQMSPHMINILSVGASESILAIVGISIPVGFHLADYDFTLSFNDQDVASAFDCSYCPSDDNLIISFRKSEVLASPVTLDYVNTEVVAAVNGYFRVEDDNGGYNTSLSTVATVEIINSAHSNLTDQADRTTFE